MYWKEANIIKVLHYTRQKVADGLFLHLFLGIIIINADNNNNNNNNTMKIQ